MNCKRNQLVKSIWLLMLLNFISPLLNAQEPEKKYKQSLLLGYHYSNTAGGELGLAFNKSEGEISSLNSGYRSYVNHALSVEFYPSDKHTIAPKYTFWRNLFSSSIFLGGSALYITNFSESDVCLRPEASFAFGLDEFTRYNHWYSRFQFKLAYSYSFYWNKDNSSLGNTHLVSLLMCRSKKPSSNYID